MKKRSFIVVAFLTLIQLPLKAAELTATASIEFYRYLISKSVSIATRALIANSVSKSLALKTAANSWLLAALTTAGLAYLAIGEYSLMSDEQVASYEKKFPGVNQSLVLGELSNALIENQKSQTAPVIYTWTNQAKDNTIATDLNKPVSDEFILSEDFGSKLKEATYRRHPTVNGYAVNTFWPDPRDPLAKDNVPLISINNSSHLNANGGFFWSESNFHIFIGGGFCIEASDDGYVYAKPCLMNNLRQMWHRAMVNVNERYSYSYSGYMGFVFRSAFFVNKCMSSQDRGGGATPYLRSCDYRNNNVSKGWLQVFEIPDEPIDNPVGSSSPLRSTETFVKLDDRGTFTQLSTDFRCSVAAGILNLREEIDAKTLAELDSWCKRHEYPLSSVDLVASGTNFLPAHEDLRRAATNNEINEYLGEFVDTSPIDTNPVAPTPISEAVQNGVGTFTRDHYFGTPSLMPLQPNQWRCIIMNVGKGNYVVCDGTDWAHPVVLDAGTSGLRASFDYTPIGFKQNFSTYLSQDTGMQTITNSGLKTNALTNSAPIVRQRSPLIILSHGDEDHISLLPSIAVSDTFAMTPKVLLGANDLKYFGETSQKFKWPVGSWIKNQIGNFPQHTSYSIRLTTSPGQLEGQAFSSLTNGSVGTRFNSFDLIKGDWSSAWMSDKDNLGVPRLYILAANTGTESGDRYDPNGDSLAICITDGYNSFISLGDVTAKGESAVLKRIGRLKVCGSKPVVLTSHHGSNTKVINSKSTLSQFGAAAFIFSAGRNSPRHPALDSVINALDAGAIPLSTIPGSQLIGYVGQRRHAFIQKSAVFSTTHSGDIAVTMTPPGGRVNSLLKSSVFVSEYSSQLSIRPSTEFYFSGHAFLSARAGSATDKPRSDIDDFANLDRHRHITGSSTTGSYVPWSHFAYLACSEQPSGTSFDVTENKGATSERKYSLLYKQSSLPNWNVGFPSSVLDYQYLGPSSFDNIAARQLPSTQRILDKCPR